MTASYTTFNIAREPHTVLEILPASSSDASLLMFGEKETTLAGFLGFTGEEFFEGRQEKYVFIPVLRIFHVRTCSSSLSRHTQPQRRLASLFSSGHTM
jgi:hypothetical protein